jgi:hypothetical protein
MLRRLTPLLAAGALCGAIASSAAQLLEFELKGNAVLG